MFDLSSKRKFIMAHLKQLIYVVVFLLIGNTGLHAADLKNGILGIQWGTNIADLPDLVKISKKEDVSYYGNSKQSYTIFGIENPYVVFGFFKDRLFATYIQVESIQVFNRVIDHISQKFGPPQKILKVIENQTIYRWKHENSKIKLKLHENEGKMKLSFYYTPLSVKVNQAQQAVFPPALKPNAYSKERRLNDAIELLGF